MSWWRLTFGCVALVGAGCGPRVVDPDAGGDGGSDDTGVGAGTGGEASSSISTSAGDTVSTGETAHGSESSTTGGEPDPLPACSNPPTVSMWSVSADSHVNVITSIGVPDRPCIASYAAPEYGKGVVALELDETSGAELVLEGANYDPELHELVVLGFAPP